MKYIFDVAFVRDHDSLKAGRTVDGVHRVAVVADTFNDAHLLAAQLVGATSGIPTEVRDVS